MKIIKCKLVDGGLSVELTIHRTEKNKSVTTLEETHHTPVHVDFKSAMKALAIHFGLLTDYIAGHQVVDIAHYDVTLIKNLVVTSYKIKDSEEDGGITITGQKIRGNGKVIIVNTPFTRFIEAPETVYQHIDHLKKQIEVVEREIELYLGGKAAPEAQLSLELPEGKPKRKVEKDPAGKKVAKKKAENDSEDDTDDHVTKVPAKPVKKAAKKVAKKAASKK